MKSPQELTARLAQQWNSADWRERQLLGTATAWPLTLPIGQPDTAVFLNDAATLRSHLQQFEKLLGSGSEAGKKLDFLLQEMQREANTMLSKTPGVDAEGLAITEVALEVKAEIERLREQIQNVE